jgi:hypothetical protein
MTMTLWAAISGLMRCNVSLGLHCKPLLAVWIALVGLAAPVGIVLQHPIINPQRRMTALLRRSSVLLTDPVETGVFSLPMGS